MLRALLLEHISQRTPSRGRGGRLRRPQQAAFLRCALVCALLACSHSPAPGRSQPRVVIRNRTGKELAVKVEVARSEPERARGLMYRQSLEEGRGMPFPFDRPTRLSFWMKNTYIPLDMIFIDARHQVVGI